MSSRLPAPKGKKDPEDPSSTSVEWDEMIPKWDMMDTILGGTEAMREAGPLYLPRHANETDQNYSDRLLSTTLLNMTELTLNALVGRPFSDPIEYSDDMPEDIRDMAVLDVDLQGNDLPTFCREWFRDGVAKGLSHAIVDMPRLEEEEVAERTRADDLQEKRRPYWVHVTPENLIYAASTIVNGQEVLTHIRIFQVVVEQAGFTQLFKEQIRVMEPGFVQIWEKDPKKQGKTAWSIVDEWETGLDFIPLVTFYANRKAFMLAKPPLEDLAFLNVRHWQSTSDQVNILTVARFPMLAVAGATDTSGTVMTIGPRQLLGTRDSQGRFYYVEHSGKAIQAGQDDLDQLEEQMGLYGADFLRRKSGDTTATARALDSAESNTSLADMVVRFENAVDTLLDMTAQWMDMDEGGTIEISKDYGPEEVERSDLEALVASRRNRDISREAFLLELKRRGLLADEFDPDSDLEQMVRERKKLIEVGILDEDVKPEEEDLDTGEIKPADGDGDALGAAT